jgi:hypothetical protein
MYRSAWACPPDHYFEAHTKYLQLADKASRTVAMLTERLDQHRGRGHQQIVVKHVTVNADQAMVAESIVAGNVPRKETSLLAVTGADSPMQILEPTQKEAVRTGGGTKSKMSVNPMQNMQKAHAAPRCNAKSKRTGRRCKAPAVRGFRVCRMHGARGGAS